MRKLTIFSCGFTQVAAATIEEAIAMFRALNLNNIDTVHCGGTVYVSE